MKKKAKAPGKSPTSFRVSEEFRAALRAAAKKEMRSEANLLHVALMEFCERHKIEVPGVVRKGVGTKTNGRVEQSGQRLPGPSVRPASTIR